MDEIFRKDTPGSDTSPYVDAITFFQEEIGRQVKDVHERENEKVRQAFVNRSRWWIGIGVTAVGIGVALVGIIGFQFANLSGRVDEFNRELRDVRDRITVIETERKFKKAENPAE